MLENVTPQQDLANRVAYVVHMTRCSEADDYVGPGIARRKDPRGFFFFLAARVLRELVAVLPRGDQLFR